MTTAEKRERTGWSLRGVLSETFRGFRADRGLDLAGSLAFTTVLTAVPLLATFSLLLATFFRENDEQILAIVNAVLPYQTARLTQNMRDFIAESTAISTVGLLLTVIASVRLIFVVEGVFNAVWGAPRRRRRPTRFIIYAFGLAALFLVLGGIGWGLRALRRSVEMDSLLNSPAVGVAPFLLKAFFLTLLYRYMPNARVRLLAAAVAGASVALGLELLRAGFGLYAETLLRMNLITGSLAFVLFAILSLYFAWVLILLGVELTHTLQVHAPFRGRGREREGRIERAIRMLLRMSTADLAPVRDIETNPAAVPAETTAILDDLESAGLVIGTHAGGFRLAMPPRDITVARIAEALSPGLYDLSPGNRDRVSYVLEPLFDRMVAERRTLLSTSLSELRPR